MSIFFIDYRVKHLNFRFRTHTASYEGDGINVETDDIGVDLCAIISFW